MTTLRKPLTALLSAVVLTTALGASFGTTSAGAMTPAQSTSTGTVNTLYYDMDAFWKNNFRNWGWSAYYRSPVIHHYNTDTYQCGMYMSKNNAWACSGAYIGHIWFGTGWTQSLHNTYGDYGSGVILAHEWGHEIMYDLGWKSRSGTIGSELFADCLAGMYTRYGITVSRKLDNSDYWEGYYSLRSIAGGDHGTSQNRSDWYYYGYSAYNINSCAAALN